MCVRRGTGHQGHKGGRSRAPAVALPADRVSEGAATGRERTGDEGGTGGVMTRDVNDGLPLRKVQDSYERYKLKKISEMTTRTNCKLIRARHTK